MAIPNITTIPEGGVPKGEESDDIFVQKTEELFIHLHDVFSPEINNTIDEINSLATELESLEANVVAKHDIVVAKEALMSPHYANIDIVAENIGTIGSKIGVDDIRNATEKETPVDADELAILDSANSFSLKKLTWANLKATLGNLFAPLVSPALTGTPTAPTAPTGTNTKQLATTEYANSIAGGTTVPAKSLASNGYVKMANGLIIQWGTGAAIANASTGAITFPISFPSSTFKVLVSSNDASYDAFFTVVSYTTSSVTLRLRNYSAGSSVVPLIIAIGY